MINKQSRPIQIFITYVKAITLSHSVRKIVAGNRRAITATLDVFQGYRTNAQGELLVRILLYEIGERLCEK